MDEVVKAYLKCRLEVILDKLNDLIALDMDAVSSYEAAIARIVALPLKERLLRFQRDHERHVSELTELVRTYEGTPRTHRDMKGYAMQALTAVTSMIGDEAEAIRKSARLFELGVMVIGFVFPVVPKGQARLRVQVSAALTDGHIDQALDAFSKL